MSDTALESSEEHGELENLNTRSNKTLKFFLAGTGSWPGEVLGQKVSYASLFQRKSLTLHTLILIVGEINYIYRNIKRISFFVLGHVYITLCLTAVTHVRSHISLNKKYGELAQFFFTTFDLHHFKQKGEYYEKVTAIVNKVSHYYAYFMTLSMVCAMVLFNVLPLYNNYAKGVFTTGLKENDTAEFSVYYLFPGFTPDDHFLLVSIMNLYYTYNCSTIICFYDLLMSIMVFHVIGHIELLVYNLNHFPKSKYQIKVSDIVVEMYNEEENEIVNKKLIDCINHHKLIVSFTDDISSIFGPMLGFNYLFHLISCCLMLMECSQLDPKALARYGPLTIMSFGQLIQTSVLFEVMASQSEKLIDVLYHVPWECMDNRNRKSLSIFLNRLQTPITVSAMGTLCIGVQAMASILKTTFSYFTFLQSMND